LFVYILNNYLFIPDNEHSWSASSSWGSRPDFSAFRGQR
jgi:hypothetical protein